jgi:hypothetical protein
VERGEHHILAFIDEARQRSRMIWQASYVIILDVISHDLRFELVVSVIRIRIRIHVSVALARADAGSSVSLQGRSVENTRVSPHTMNIM